MLIAAGQRTQLEKHGSDWYKDRLWTDQGYFIKLHYHLDEHYKGQDMNDNAIKSLQPFEGTAPWL